MAEKFIPKTRSIRRRLQRRSLLAAMLAFTVVPSASNATELLVGLEPAPPTVTLDGGGTLVELLRKIEEISDLKFKIVLAPYNRSKIQLKHGKMDIIGILPAKAERQEFYDYAQELNWVIPAYIDLYCIRPVCLETGAHLDSIRIGIPRGNEDAFTRKLGVPMENWVPGDVQKLLKMLVAKRVDAVLLERDSARFLIKEMAMGPVWYRQMTSSPGALAVAANPRGDALKSRLDGLLFQLANERGNPTARLFGSPVVNETALPTSGRFP